MLRRYTHDDISDVLAFVSDLSVSRVTTEIEVSEKGIAKYINKQNSYKDFEHGKCFDLAMERKEDGKVIGLLSLICKDHKQGQIGWALGVDYRGYGYATEGARALIEYGFTRLGLHRIYADTTSVNPASQKVAEHLGMRQEARLREAEFRDGQWLDYLIYGILKNEYHAQ